MRILNRYMLESFVVTFVVTLVVVTFVITLGGLFQFVDSLAVGVSWFLILKLFMVTTAFALVFSIPVSAAITSLLVFERISGDSEVTAMKACGVSMWQIVSRPVLFSVLLTAISLYVNANLASYSHYLQRRIVHQHKEELAKILWEPGRFIKPPTAGADYWVYVAESQYDEQLKGHKVSNVIIYERSQADQEREIRAEEGVIRLADGGDTLMFELKEVRVSPASHGRRGDLVAPSTQIRIDLRRLSGSTPGKDMRDHDMDELIEGIMTRKKGNKPRMWYAVELNQRLVLSVSCVAFAILGIPLGIRTRGSSSSVGIGIGLLMVFSFYVFVVLVDALAEQRPEWRPDLIIWVPAILSIGIGTLLLYRNR